MDRNKLYKIETETRTYVGYVLSEGDRYVQIVYEEENYETCKAPSKDWDWGAKSVLVPQIINIRWEKIISYQRVYENEEIEEYYFPQRAYTGGKFIPKRMIISDIQKKYVLNTLFESEEECQKECDEINKDIKIQQPPEINKELAKNYINLVKNNPEADEELSEEISEKEDAEDGRR